MAKAVLGIDIGHDQLKLALVQGGAVKKTAVARIPDGLVKGGRMVSVETMGELIRDTMRKAHLRADRGTVVVTGENVFVRNVTMPVMSVKQLEYNLPFEFHDYISGELKKFTFDYAMHTTPEELKKRAANRTEQPQPDGSGAQPTGESGAEATGMELLAVALPTEQLQENRAALRKAGLKMVGAAPDICAFAALLENQDASQEHCILDLGYDAIRLYVYRGTQHIVTRVLEQGLSNLDTVIADSSNIDVHLAHTYLVSNHEDCQNGETCRAAYNGIAVELMRALNFYRFSNPDSNLSGMWLCGGGAQIAPLRTAIAETLDITVETADALVDGGADIEDCITVLQAIGIARYGC